MPTATSAAGLLALPPAVRTVYIEAFTKAFQHLFLDAAAVAAIGFAFSWLLKELPLQDLTQVESVPENTTMPTDATSLGELETSLSN